MNDDRLIPPHGGYAELKSFQMAEIVYDGTVVFCDRFIDRRSRTHDQMAQAARKPAYEQNRTYLSYSSYISEGATEVAANTIVCLIHQANYLLDQQLRQLEQKFLEEGGFTERLYRVRSQVRTRPPKGPRPNTT